MVCLRRALELLAPDGRTELVGVRSVTVDAGDLAALANSSPGQGPGPETRRESACVAPIVPWAGDTLAYMRLTAAIGEEGDGFVARCLEVEVASQGDTFDEARANLVEALELYFEDESDVAVATSPVIAPIDVGV